jgi:hypothetical protein
MAQAAISATAPALMTTSGAPWVVPDSRMVSSRRSAAAATGVALPNGSAHGRADAAAFGGLQVARCQEAPYRCPGGRAGTPHRWERLRQSVTAREIRVQHSAYAWRIVRQPLYHLSYSPAGSDSELQGCSLAIAEEASTASKGR